MNSLSVREYFDQLFRNPMPELTDDECLSVLKEMYRQQGDRQSYLVGYEVRLKDPKRYIDCILDVKDDRTPAVGNRWVELDYESIKKDPAYPGECTFVSVRPGPDGKTAAIDEILTAFAGEDRAKRLGPVLDNVIASLPDGVYLKHIGCMDSRMETDIIRLVIHCEDTEHLGDCLEAIGWRGDVSRVLYTMKNYNGYKGFGLNVDLSQDGIMDKLGIEVFLQWRNPVLLDRVLDQLVADGLSLQDKADAIKRWIRVLPDAAPFIQTGFRYFKLEYSDTGFTQAKAYIGQMPVRMHAYYPAYYRPERADIELIADGVPADVQTISARLRECAGERIPLIRFYCLDEYESAQKLIAICGEENLDVQAAVSGRAKRERLDELVKEGVKRFLIETNAEDEAAFETAEHLTQVKAEDITVLFVLDEHNISKLKDAAFRLKQLNITGLLITQCGRVPCEEQMDRAAEIITGLMEDQEYDGMDISVDSCFSPLRARLGGTDIKRNNNRGVERGCVAGRAVIAILADGSLAPCLRLSSERDHGTIAAFWDGSDLVKDLRAADSKGQECSGCPYARRCLPCPVFH